MNITGVGEVAVVVTGAGLQVLDDGNLDLELHVELRTPVAAVEITRSVNGIYTNEVTEHGPLDLDDPGTLLDVLRAERELDDDELDAQNRGVDMLQNHLHALYYDAAGGLTEAAATWLASWTAEHPERS